MDHIMMSDAVRAIILGIVEGITEFLPVSSTGHMLLVQRFFGLGDGAFWNSFVVLIQLGAILAIVILYFGMPVSQISFTRLTTPAEKPYGSSGSKYQDQTGPEPSRFYLNYRQALPDRPQRPRRHQG